MQNKAQCRLCSLASVRSIRSTLTALREDGTSATLNRLFQSKHVLDLKLIVQVTVLVTIAAVIVAIPLMLAKNWTEIADANGHWAAPVLKALVDYFIYIGPVLAAAGLVVAWAYRQGSARLGVVDLFASEISTVCRVGTILDIGGQLVSAFQKGPAVASTGPDNQPGPRSVFVSEENYFPVFENNAEDLQVLEAHVIERITSFYTYMKTAKDYLRIRAQIEQVASTDGVMRERWNDVMTSLIYMLFLAYESARKAVDKLVEYEPDRVEYKITILLTELKCFQFLSLRFADKTDARSARLALRRHEYHKIVPKLCSIDGDAFGAMKNRQSCRWAGTRPIDEAHLGDVAEGDWERAKKTAPALWRLYEDVFDKDGTLRPIATTRPSVSDPVYSSIQTTARAA